MSKPGFWQRKWIDENALRIAEGNILRERAITIKQIADDKALQLSREAQKYRDEQANKLREQINSERNTYATKEDLSKSEEKLLAALDPLKAAMQQGVGSQISRSQFWSGVGLLLAVLTLIVAYMNGRL